MTSSNHQQPPDQIVIKEGSIAQTVFLLLFVGGFLFYVGQLLVEIGETGAVAVLVVAGLSVLMVATLQRRQFILTPETLIIARRTGNQTVQLRELAGLGLRPPRNGRGSPSVVFWSHKNYDLLVTRIAPEHLALLLKHLRAALPNLQVERELERYAQRAAL